MKVARGEFEEDEFMTISVTLRIIVSYDVDSRQNVEATAIYRFIHGREVTMRIKGGRGSIGIPGSCQGPAWMRSVNLCC